MIGEVFVDLLALGDGMRVHGLMPMACGVRNLFVNDLRNHDGFLDVLEDSHGFRDFLFFLSWHLDNDIKSLADGLLDFALSDDFGGDHVLLLEFFLDLHVFHDFLLSSHGDLHFDHHVDGGGDADGLLHSVFFGSRDLNLDLGDDVN